MKNFMLFMLLCTIFNCSKESSTIYNPISKVEPHIIMEQAMVNSTIEFNLGDIGVQFIKISVKSGTDGDWVLPSSYSLNSRGRLHINVDGQFENGICKVEIRE